MPNFLKQWGASFDAPLHIVLRRFKLVPILVLIFFMGLTCWVTSWYMGVAVELNDWGVAPIMGYLATLTGCVKWAMENIRLGEQKDKYDEPS